MKKLILPFIAVLTSISCKKEANVAPDIISSDSVNTAKNDIVSSNKSTFKIVEYTPEQISNLVNGNKNDTLYVTNFFATWCVPCIREIPHFKEKMDELKDKPVKFTFVNLDQKAVWDTDVRNFVEKHGIAKQTVLLDINLLDASFFNSNFKTWKGETIPFTYMRKGDKTEEINGSMSKEEMDNKINNALLK